eukprot:2006064-Amphidinium_carterae.2
MRELCVGLLTRAKGKRLAPIKPTSLPRITPQQKKLMRFLICCKQSCKALKQMRYMRNIGLPAIRRRPLVMLYSLVQRTAASSAHTMCI